MKEYYKRDFKAVYDQQPTKPRIGRGERTACKLAWMGKTTRKNSE